MKILYKAQNVNIDKAQLLLTEGLYYFKLQNLKEAERCFTESLELASKNNEQYLIASNKLRLFQTKVYSGVIDESVMQAFEAFNYYKKNNYPEDMAYAQFLIGDSYRFQGNLEGV
ncbi:MAG: tetratricopeptide repeat protein [Segetibacter sp.]